MVITECGAGSRAGFHGKDTELFTEEMQERIFKSQVATISPVPYIRGMTPWILYDFRSPRRLNKYQEGFNRKGLVAEDRKTRKLAVLVLADFSAASDEAGNSRFENMMWETGGDFRKYDWRNRP